MVFSQALVTNFRGVMIKIAQLMSISWGGVTMSIVGCVNIKSKYIDRTCQMVS